jgi:hypothetical protein
MDELAKRLREDAAKIDAEVSAQLESRLQASLAAIEPDAARKSRPQRRPAWFWFASSLTGVAAALAVIAVLNLGDPTEPAAVPRVVANNPAQPVTVPILDLEVEAAMLTSPLAQELEDLQADLKKAEEIVRGDVRIDF